MSAADPRVQRAREAANYPTNQHDMHGILCELLDVVDELRQWKTDAAEVTMGLQDLGRALDVPLGKRITGHVGVTAAKRLRARAEAAEQECEDLLAKVGELEAVIRYERATGLNWQSENYASPGRERRMDNNDPGDQ